jgi:hypothetical protein
MKHVGVVVVIALSFGLWVRAANPQVDSVSTTLTERGQVKVSGRETPYVIHRLPVSSFPQLPRSIAGELESRGCLIPQTYEAHRPENVIQASLERAGSSDWAALCSSGGTVKLMVFFASSPESPTVLVSEPETARMETHDLTGVLGFAWGIDPASPRKVHDAQSTMNHRPPMLDHDALADSFVEKGTVYHYFSKDGWKIVETSD